MSPHAANSLVHDLVEMAKAMERLPELQAELNSANDQVEAYARQVQRLELTLIDRSNEIDNANAARRKAEAERDSAESMFLETDDKLLAFRRLVSAFSTDAATLLRAQEPAVEPQVEQAIREDIVHLETTSDPAPTSGQSEAGPTPDPVLMEAPAPSGEASSTTDSVGTDLPGEDTASANPTVGSAVGPIASLASAAPAPAESVADAPDDDVGYHNEPDADMAHWRWEDWAERMSRRYGANSWPKRSWA